MECTYYRIVMRHYCSQQSGHC